MRDSVAAALCAFLVLAAAAASARADETFTPSWMHPDAAAKSVRIELVAGWNANNGALNYNGYYKGDMTIVVPLGWTVDVDFRNHDGMLPHSLVATRPFAPDKIPMQAGVGQLAIGKAYSVDPESGIMADHHDEVRFAARDAGQFWLICGVTGHALQGMWVKLGVDAQADGPHIAIADGAEPGWR
jgi:sulfocyanin